MKIIKILLFFLIVTVRWSSAELDLIDDDELDGFHAQGLIIENEEVGDQQIITIGLEGTLSLYATAYDVVTGGDALNSTDTDADSHIDELVIGKSKSNPLIADNIYMTYILNKSSGTAVFEEIRMGAALLNGQFSFPEGARSLSGSLTALDPLSLTGGTMTVEGYRMDSIPLGDTPIEIPTTAMNEMIFTDAEGVYMYLAQAGADLPGFGLVVPPQANGGTVETSLHDIEPPPPPPEPCLPPTPPWEC